MTFFVTDPALQAAGDRCIETLCAREGIPRQRLALTYVAYDVSSAIDGATDPTAFWSRKVRGYSHRGIELIEPGTLVHLFYAVALQDWLHVGMLSGTEEIERALHDAIVWGSVDAAGLLVDVLSGTTSGPEVGGGAFETWAFQRQIVNRYFRNLGVQEYSYINVCQKTWCDRPYGRERVFCGQQMENRNLLTTNAVAHLLHGIIGGIAVARDRSAHLRRLLYREGTSVYPQPAVYRNLLAALPTGSQLWAIAAQTSHLQHLAAYIERPDRPAIAIVLFVEGEGMPPNLLPLLGSDAIAALEA